MTGVGSLVPLYFPTIPLWFVLLVLALLLGPPLLGVGYGIRRSNAGRPNGDVYVTAGIVSFGLLLFIASVDLPGTAFGVSVETVVLLGVPAIHAVRERETEGCRSWTLVGIYAPNLLIGLHGFGVSLGVA